MRFGDEILCSVV